MTLKTNLDDVRKTSNQLHQLNYGMRIIIVLLTLKLSRGDFYLGRICLFGTSLITLQREHSFQDFRRKMGAQLAKLAKRKEKGSGNHKEQAKRQIQADRQSSVENARRNGKERLKRKTLKELQRECPPGFRKFELEVGWQSIDEEIALQLWEDVFKPLYTFH